MWGMLTAGAPPVRALFDLIGPPVQDRLRSRPEELIQDPFGGEPITTPTVALLASGTAP